MDKTAITCETCGAQVSRTNARQRFCSECARERIRVKDRARRPPGTRGAIEITCAACGERVPRTGRNQRYCKPCASDRLRTWHRDNERERRADLADEINARTRERYATDAHFRARTQAAGKRSYQSAKADPERNAALLIRGREATSRHRDKVLYGGQRQRVIARDGGRCRRCGTSETLHVHHLDGTGWTTPAEHKNNEARNLVTLCASCHARTHRENEARAEIKQLEMLMQKYPEVTRVRPTA